MAIMGFSHYTLKQGKIIFRGRDITNLPPL